MIAFDYEREGGLADDDEIKNIRIFHKFFTKFWANFVSEFQKFLSRKKRKWMLLRNWNFIA